MQFKTITTYIRGLFESEGKEHRVNDQFLIKAMNIDIDPSGKIMRRRGYEYWPDLESSESVTSFVSIPDVSTFTGFGNKIQSIYPFTDQDNKHFLCIIANGKIYIEAYNNELKTWTVLNPGANIDIVNKNLHIDIVSYLDVLFFNDYRENIYMYNSQNYTSEGWIISGVRHIYFAGQEIYFREYSNFDLKYHTHTITDITNAIDDIIHIAGDYRHNFTVGQTVTVTGNDTAANNTSYVVKTIAWDAAAVETDITITGAMSDPADVSGSLNSPYRIRIESNTVNPEGMLVHDGLANISYIGADRIIAAATDLKLGYCVRYGNDITGYNYYVLDNGLNERATDKCYIIKFNDRFIAQNYIELAIDAVGEVLNFEIYDDNIYICCSDGVVHKISLGLVDAPINSGDITSLQAPTNHSGKKQYSVTANAEGIFLYTDKLPNKSDWWQPVIIDNVEFTTLDPTMAFTYYAFTDSHKTTLSKTYLKELSVGAEEYELNKNFYSYNSSDTPMHHWSHNVYNLFDPLIYYHGTYNTHFDRYKGFSLDFNVVSGYGFSSNKIGFWDFKNIIDETDSHTVYYYATIGSLGSDTFLRYDSSNYHTQVQTHTNGNTTWPNIYRSGLLPVGYDERGFDPTNALFSAFPLSYDYYKESLETSFTDKKIIYNNNFQYDKESDSPANKVIWTLVGDDFVCNSSAYYLNGSSFNADIFTDVTTPKYVLLVVIGEDGNLKTKTDLVGIDGDVKTWRYILPLGKTGAGELRSVCPLIVDGTTLYLGTSMEDGTAGEDKGLYMKLNLSDWTFETKSCQISSRRYKIPGSDNWFMKGAADESYYKAGSSWDYALGYSYANDYYLLSTYNSNLVYCLYKQIVDFSGTAEFERIQYLGTPKVPTVSMKRNAASDFVKGTKFRYQIAYQFTSGQTTMLSTSSEDIEIPNLSVADPQLIEMLLEDLDLTNQAGLAIYAIADISYIEVYRSKLDVGQTKWSEPTLLTQIGKTGGVFDASTYSDYVQSPTFSPFTVANVRKYPVNHICVHKNRLILINKTDDDNANAIYYSDTDVAEAIPSSNIRTIESGDGDNLIAGVSMSDYLYLFKTSKIYAILGDAVDGELIDITRTIGTPYKNMIAQNNNVIYFINQYGVYALANNRVADLNKGGTNINRLRNYFDRQNHDCIDFNNIEDNGFTFVDIENKEILFFVPQKENGIAQTTNNTVIIYNTEYDFWRTYQFHHQIFAATYARDIATGDYQKLIADTSGNIYKITKNKNDAGNAIQYIIRTKEMTLGTKLVKKIFKAIKMHGRFLNSIYITYWIDGERQVGKLAYRDSRSGQGEGFLKPRTRGPANGIVIEISGEDINEAPFEIDEILIGFDPSRRMR